MLPTGEERILRTGGNSARALGYPERAVLRRTVWAMAGGHAPTVETLSREMRLPTAVVRAAIRSLEACDCVVMDGDRVRAAYPFTTDRVPHTVVSSSGTARANCAVDALGVGEMLGEEVEIRSACPQCGTSIQLRGRREFEATPPKPMVFLPPLDMIQGHAADCVCPSISFYCSEEHGRAHLALVGRGRLLSLEEATALGLTAFGDLLRQNSQQSRKASTTRGPGVDG